MIIRLASRQYSRRCWVRHQVITSSIGLIRLA